MAVTTSGGRGWFGALTKPPGTPPDWVFAPVWTGLYLMIAVAAWLVWRHANPAADRALRLWGWQLLLNAMWVPAFFGMRSTSLGVAVIVPLLILVAFTLRAFVRIDRAAAALMAPYLLWTAYATYLATGFFILNAL